MKVSLNWIKKYIDLPTNKTSKDIAYDKHNCGAGKQQRKSIPKYFLRALFLLRAPCYSKKRCAAHSEQICKRRDKRGKRERKPDACQRKAACPRQMPYVHPVNYIV